MKEEEKIYIDKSRNLIKFVLVLLSASVQRAGVSRMRDFKNTLKMFQKILPNLGHFTKVKMLKRANYLKFIKTVAKENIQIYSNKFVIIISNIIFIHIHGTSVP